MHLKRNEKIIENKAIVLEKIINKLGKKVRIYPIIKHTKKKTGQKYGYQYLLQDSTISDPLLSYVPNKDSKNEPRYFEIDLKNDKDALKKLKFILALSSCYKHKAGGAVSTSNTKLLFAISRDYIMLDRGVPNPDAIDCVFGGNRLYDTSELFSRDLDDPYRYLHLYTDESPLNPSDEFIGPTSSYQGEWSYAGRLIPVGMNEAFPEQKPEEEPKEWWYEKWW